MDRTAITANPLSYSQTCDTFRPRLGQCAASRAGLGGKRLIHFFVPCAIRNRLVRKHRFEGMPGCVVNAFRHPGFGEFSAADVANSDVIESPHDVRADLVQEVLPSVGDLGVDFRCQSLLSGALRLRQFFFKLPETPGMLDLLASGQRSQIGKPQVDADATHRLPHLDSRNLDHDVQEPIASPVLAEAGAILDLAFRQGSGIEHAERVASEAESIAMAFQIPALERHPAKRTLAPVAKERAIELLARLCVLLAHGVDRAGVDAKFLAAASGQDVQIKPGGPSLAPLERVFLRVIAEVPDEIYRPRLLVQQAVQRLYAVAVNLRTHRRFRYSSMARRMCSATESPVFSDNALSAATTGSGRNICVRFIHTLYLFLYPVVQPTGCAPFLPGLNAGISRSI
ncbi:hypothetical protein AAEX37_00064 [Oligella sp. MSHR50489EDL]